MEKKRLVQMLFTESEYESLEKRANAVDLTVPLFIKSEMLHGDDFGSAYQKLMKKVEELPPGTTFALPPLFGMEWLPLSAGVRMNLGKMFLRKVQAGKIPNVKLLEVDQSNLKWYLKE